MTTDYKLTAKEREELTSAIGRIREGVVFASKAAALGGADAMSAAVERSAQDVLFLTVEGIVLDHLIAEREMMGKT